MQTRQWLSDIEGTKYIYMQLKNLELNLKYSVMNRSVGLSNYRISLRILHFTVKSIKLLLKIFFAYSINVHKTHCLVFYIRKFYPAVKNFLPKLFVSLFKTVLKKYIHQINFVISIPSCTLFCSFLFFITLLMQVDFCCYHSE